MAARADEGDGDPHVSTLIAEAIQEEQAVKKQKKSKSVRFSQDDEVHHFSASDEVCTQHHHRLLDHAQRSMVHDCVQLSHNGGTRTLATMPDRSCC